MDIDKNYHLFSGHSISTIVFQISNLLSFIKRDLKKGLFLFFNVSGSFLVSKHTKKKPRIRQGHREYCSSHSHK